MSPYETSESFAAALAAALPDAATSFATEAVEGYAWPSRLAARITMDMPVFLGLSRDGSPRAGVARWIATGAEPSCEHAHLLPLLKDLGLAGSGPRPLREARVDPSASAFAARFAASLDLEAVRALVEANATDVDAYDWLAARGSERTRRHQLAASYPWAVDAVLEGGAEMWDDTDEDLACDLIRSGDLAGCGPEGTLRHVVRRVRGMGFEGFDRRELVGDLRALTFMPKAWIPEGKEDLMALAALAPHLVAFASTGGRPLSEAMRPGDGWSASLKRMTARTGLIRASSSPRDAAAGISRLVRDMTEAFHRQVAWPAAVQVEAGLRDCPPKPPTLGGDGRGQRVGLSAVSHRILFGDKGFPAAVEAGARWNAGLTGIANVVAGVAAAEKVAWLPAFAPVKDRLGVVVSCISDAEDMLREAGELGHCVCTYLPRCLSGESVIASVRSLDPSGRVRERLSTVEMRWRPDGVLHPVQHHGNGNGPAPDVAVFAIRRFSEALRSGAVATTRGGSPSEANAVLLSLYRDSFDLLSDAWGQHLPQSLRGRGALELLSAGGVDVPALRDAVERAASGPGAPGARR